MLTEKYPSEIEAIFAKYPLTRNARADAAAAFGPARDRLRDQAVMDEIASLCEVSVTEAASLVGFYTLFTTASRQVPHPVCTDLPCALRGAEQFIEKPV